MCNRVRQASNTRLQTQFGAVLILDEDGVEKPLDHFQDEKRDQESGYDRPKMPVLTRWPNNGQFVMMNWGYLRSFTDKPILNARADKLLSGMWAESARNRRCIIPLDGFYDHQTREVPGKRPGTTKKEKVAYYIDKPNGVLFAAGVWEEVGGKKYFAIITTDPNATMRTIHDRQPHVIDTEDWPRWFGRLDDAGILAMCGIYPDTNLRYDEYHPDPTPPPPPLDPPSLF